MVVRPKSSAAVPLPTFATANVPPPVVRSVSFNRLPSLPIAAESFVGEAALIAVSTSPSVLAVPKSMSTVDPSASVTLKSLPLRSCDAIAVVERRERRCLVCSVNTSLPVADAVAGRRCRPAPSRWPSFRRRLPEL